MKTYPQNQESIDKLKKMAEELRLSMRANIEAAKLLVLYSGLKNPGAVDKNTIVPQT